MKKLLLCAVFVGLPCMDLLAYERSGTERSEIAESLNEHGDKKGADLSMVADDADMHIIAEPIEQSSFKLPPISWPTAQERVLGKNTEKRTDQRLFVMNLHIPASTRATGLCAYYKGYPLQLSNALCILPEQDKRLTFSYVITEEVDVKARGNTVQCLKRKSDIACKWYDLTLTIDDSGEDSTYSWTVEEKKGVRMPECLPDHAILIQVDPNLIDRIESVQDTPLESDIVYLPTIFLKEDEDFSQKSVCAVLASIDLRTMHREPERTIQIPNNKTAITMPAQILQTCLCKR